MVRHLIGTISVAGMALAVALLLAHSNLSALDDAEGLLPMAICGEGGGCDEVLNSRWAWFPPLPLDGGLAEGARAAVDEESFGGVRLPVALLGLFYFTVLALWMWTNAIGGRRYGLLLLGFCTAGLLASVAFLTVMFRSVGAVCPLCFSVHVANFLVFGLVVKQFADRPERDSGADELPVSFRTVRGFAGLVVPVLLLQGMLWHNLALQKRHQIASDALRELQANVEAIEMIYLGQKRQEVSVRDDSMTGLDAIEFDALLPAIGTGYRNTIVVFGDVECGACRRFHEFLMNEVRPDHNGHLRVVFKHRPLDPIHPNARKAALALEAARRQGKFWELLERLYAQQGSLSGFDYASAVGDLKMDLVRFVRDMSSADAAERIKEDEMLADSLGVTGTPAVFLNNRRVDKSILRVPGFWSRQVDRLKRSRQEAGQPWENSKSPGPDGAVALGRGAG